MPIAQPTKINNTTAHAGNFMKLIYNRTNENYHVTAWHCWCKQTDKEFFQIILWNDYGDPMLTKTIFDGSLQATMQEARLMLAGVWK